MLSYILWNPDVIAFRIGPLAFRWYSLLWLIGLAGAYMIVKRVFKDDKLPDEKFEPLFFYCFAGIILGARLGHCIFYQPDYFLSSAAGVFEMFVPVKLLGDGVMQSLGSGAWKFIGYEGLASHGGTLGIILALMLYSRRMKLKLMYLFDACCIAVPLTACCIRLGNLMNSEIIGQPSNVPWAFIFERVDMLPRHPGQLYEAIAYAVLGIVTYYIYKRTRAIASLRPPFPLSPGITAPQPGNISAASNGKPSSTSAASNGKPNSTSAASNGKPSSIFSPSSAEGKSLTGTGFYFGLCLTYIFTFRFFIELTKENQEAFEQGMMFNMGQLLSLPFIIIGIWAMVRAVRKR